MRESAYDEGEKSTKERKEGDQSNRPDRNTMLSSKLDPGFSSSDVPVRVICNRGIISKRQSTTNLGPSPNPISTTPQEEEKKGTGEGGSRNLPTTILRPFPNASLTTFSHFGFVLSSS
jgi:hypothetical protein